MTKFAAGGELSRRNGSGLITPLKAPRASLNANVWLSVGTPDCVGVDARGGGESGGLDFRLETLSVRLDDRLLDEMGLGGEFEWELECG